MRLNIKNKYKRLYKKQEAAPVPITSDEYGEWEQVGYKEKSFSIIESYRLIGSGGAHSYYEDDMENFSAHDQSPINWKEILLYSDPWSNHETGESWNNIDIPYKIYYYNIVYWRGTDKIKTKLSKKDIEFYPSGYIKGEIIWDDLDPITGQLTTIAVPHANYYEDGEKVLQF